MSTAARQHRNPNRANEAAEVLDDIRIAEAEIARGEGVEHEAAKAQVLAHLLRKDR